MKFNYLILILLSFGILSGCTNDKPKKKPTLAKTETTRKTIPTPTPKAEEIKAESQEEPEAEAEIEEPVPPEQLAKAKAIIAGITNADLAAVDGKKKYKTYCAACHGFNGQLGINGAKDLSESKLALHESVAQIYFGRGLMTPFKGVMKDAEIVAVAKYIEKELR